MAKKNSSSNLKNSYGRKQDIPSPVRRKSHPVRNGLILLLIFFLFFTPMRTTVLLIGIDRVPEGSNAGRSDTMILATMPPFLPEVSLFSIPRDLWVNIPGVGENRINTAHYFAELYQPGTGMDAAAGVVEANFGIDVPYVIRIKFDGLINIVDAMGGVTIDLPEAMSGLEAGVNHLDGTQALAFVRDRKGSDDFSRQKRGQMFINAAFRTMLNPVKWLRIPVIIPAVLKAVDTNIPAYAWPRVIYGFAFSAVFGFDAQTLDRNWVTPWVTNEGAQVLLPNWDLILPAIDQIFN
jgi:LCP family protein required for cell wall assembly